MTESNDPKGYYRALGLAPNASQAQIDHAYREWAKRYHPDVKGSGNPAEFIRIKEAHDILSDPMRRAQYDRSGFGASQQNSPRGEPPGGQTNQAKEPLINSLSTRYRNVR